LTSLDGPNTIECLSRLWLRGGCVKNTVFFPSNLNQERLIALQTISIRYVPF